MTANVTVAAPIPSYLVASSNVVVSVPVSLATVAAPVPAYALLAIEMSAPVATLTVDSSAKSLRFGTRVGQLWP